MSPLMRLNPIKWYRAVKLTWMLHQEAKRRMPNATREERLRAMQRAADILAEQQEKK